MSGEHTHDDQGYADATLVEDAVKGLSDRLMRAEASQTATDAVIRSLLSRLAAVEASNVALAEGLTNMATWYRYSGKPAGSLTVKAGDGYVRVDVDVPDPPRSGVLELHMLYANCALAFKAGESDGVIRVKYTREDGDETGYQDYIVTRDGVLGSPGSFLITAQHFELGEAGLGGRWWIRCGGGLSSITLTTRYCKTAQVG